MSLLDRITFYPRIIRGDSRGWLIKVIDGFEQHLPASTGECYIVMALPGEIRGNHYHRLTSEWFTVIFGQAHLYFADPETGETHTLVFKASEPVTVYVPAGIAHAFLNPVDSESHMLLVAYADRLYDPVDTISMSLL